MTPGAGLVDIEKALLASSMWQTPFQLRHNLAGNPLVTRDALVRLTSERPPFSIAHGRSDQAVVFERPGVDPPCTAVRAVADLENSRSWITLSFVDHAPGYGDLLDAVSTEFRSVLATHDGPVRARTGTVFLTSPGGVVPAHVDRHHNILLQIEGTKELCVGEFDDDLVQEQEIHRHFEGHDYLLRLPNRFQTFTLGPGQGVYIPPYRPHWIVCDQNVSIGLSCSVRTNTSHRVELAHTFNSKLRRFGLRPGVPGVRCRLDAAKAVTVTAGREVKHARHIVANHLRKDPLPSSDK
jgi:quercetin dioxygenase-like cupin family protein